MNTSKHKYKFWMRYRKKSEELKFKRVAKCKDASDSEFAVEFFDWKHVISWMKEVWPTENQKVKVNPATILVPFEWWSVIEQLAGRSINIRHRLGIANRNENHTFSNSAWIDLDLLERCIHAGTHTHSIYVYIIIVRWRFPMDTLTTRLLCPLCYFLYSSSDSDCALTLAER